MRDVLTQIGDGLRANLYYLSLFTALAIPDICGAIDSEDGLATKEGFIQWFDKYVGSRYAGFLTGEDCYYFRCSILHQGSTQHSRSGYLRILFVEPSATSNVFHCNVMNDALNIDVRVFCMDIIQGALAWLHEVEDNSRFARNYAKFVKRYPDGLKPYIVGIPVIS